MRTQLYRHHTNDRARLAARPMKSSADGGTARSLQYLARPVWPFRTESFGFNGSDRDTERDAL